MILIVVTGGLNFHFVVLPGPEGLNPRWFMPHAEDFSGQHTGDCLSFKPDEHQTQPDGKGKLEELFQRTALFTSILIVFLAAIASIFAR
jgi:hypothetical protein